MWNYELMLKETFEEALIYNEHPEYFLEYDYNRFLTKILTKSI